MAGACESSVHSAQSCCKCNLVLKSRLVIKTPLHLCGCKMGALYTIVPIAVVPLGTPNVSVFGCPHVDSSELHSVSSWSFPLSLRLPSTHPFDLLSLPPELSWSCTQASFRFE